MKNRIKNAKWFIAAVTSVVIIGGAVSYNVATHRDIESVVLQELSSIKDDFDYGNKINLKNISVEDIIVGEELHILDSNIEFYNHVRTTSILNKITLEMMTVENEGTPKASINHLYTKARENLSATSEYYKKIVEFENEYMKNMGYDSLKIKAISNPVIIKEEDNILYLNDFVYFIDKDTNTIVDALSINSKYNHLENDLTYMKPNKMSSKNIKKIQNVLLKSLSAYDELFDKVPEIIESLTEVSSKYITSIKIYSNESILIISNENNQSKYIEVNVKDLSIKDLTQ